MTKKTSIGFCFLLSLSSYQAQSGDTSVYQGFDFMGSAAENPKYLLVLAVLLFSLTLFVFFDRSEKKQKNLLKNPGGFNHTKIAEMRIFFLFLGILVPLSELFIEHYHLRAHSELRGNIIAGAILLLIYFGSGYLEAIRRQLYRILILLYLTFVFTNLYKIAYEPFELLTFGENLLVLFFSSYVFLSLRHYWVFIGIILLFLASNFYNPNVEPKTAVLYAVISCFIILLNQAKYLVFLKSHERLLFSDAVVNNGKTLVISSDKNGQITFISENVAEILGYKPAELLGNGWWEKTIDLTTEHENEKEKIISLYMSEVVTTRLIKTKDGAYKWIQWHDKRFNDNLIVGIGQDVTELKKYEMERMQRLEKIERKSNIIHELNILPYSSEHALDENITHILKQASIGLKVERTSIWYFESNRIRCVSSYTYSTDSYEKDLTYYQKDYPYYINTLFQGSNIVAPDVYDHPATREFCSEYYPKHQICSLIDIPFYVEGKLKGKISCESVGEQRNWDTEDVSFVKSIADLLSISIETQRRKDAESLVKESENNFRQINETIEDVFWLYDIKNDKVLYISPSCKNILGAEQDYFYESNDFWSKYVLGEDKKYIKEAHQRILKDGFYEIEYRILKGTEVHWIKERSFSIRNEAGEIVKNSGICSDITVEKRLKEELRQLSLVAEKTTNGVLISDQNSKAVWANQGFLDMMEISFDELVGKRARDLFITPEDDSLTKLDEGNFYLEIEIKSFKNTKKWIGIANTVITNEKGDVIQQIEVINDITERILSKQKIESQTLILEEITKELEFQNKLKEKLIYSQSIKDLSLNALSYIYEQFDNSRQIAMVFPDATEKYLSGFSYLNGELVREEVLNSDLNSYETCKNGQVYIQKDLLNHEDKSQSDLNNLAQGVKSYIAVPIHYQSGFMGLFFLGFSTEFKLSERQINSLKEVMQIISITINQINLQEILQNKNDDIMSSIFYAKYIQESILPDLKNFSEKITRVVLLYQPKDIVSGDFYWCKETENYSFIAIADCTGHGVPGAFLMLLGMNMLEQLIGIEKLSDPSEILKKLDRRMFDTLNRNSEGLVQDGMEIALCVYDKKQRKMTYSGAGLGVLYFHDKEEIHIRGQRASIGDLKKEEFPFENTTIDISGEEYFYLATDGYQDQLGGERYKRFSKNRLIRSLDHQKELTPDEQEKILSEQMNEYMHNYPQVDDFTVIGFKIKP